MFAKRQRLFGIVCYSATFCTVAPSYPGRASWTSAIVTKQGMCRGCVMLFNRSSEGNTSVHDQQGLLALANEGRSLLEEQEAVFFWGGGSRCRRARREASASESAPEDFSESNTRAEQCYDCPTISMW